MIKQNELRIGNLLQYGDGEISVDINVLRDLNFYNQRGIEPIPLTEEWLLKCIGYNEFFDLHILEDEVVEVDNADTWEFVTNIKYLHELQNLYFCYKKQELEIKL
jgi:hypothetical protein